MNRRMLLHLAGAAALVALPGCLARGGTAPPFKSNASFKLMLYG